MRCRVYPLRRRGRRLPWREVCNAPSFEGDLSTYYLTLRSERYFVAQLLGPGHAFRKPLLPELYEPVLTNLGMACWCFGDSSGRVRRLRFRSGGARLRGTYSRSDAAFLDAFPLEQIESPRHRATARYREKWHLPYAVAFGVRVCD
jgi:hypothetical protein